MLRGCSDCGYTDSPFSLKINFDVKITDTPVYLPQRICSQLNFGKLKCLRIDDGINGTVDFGPELSTKRTSAQITANDTKEESNGRQIIGVVNIPHKQIGTFMSEFLILGFYRKYGSVILAVPDDDVPNGAKLA